MAWCFIKGLPNVDLSDAYFNASSMAPLALPTACEEIIGREKSKAFIALIQPLFSSPPIKFSFGTRTSLKITERVSEHL